MLLQKRAAEKYHCGGLWSNACCSHPVPDKPIQRCLQEKLQQEMGMNAELEKAFEFTYRAELNNGLIEHEYDHIYLGYTAALPQPNPSEVSEWRYINIEGLEQELKLHPECFTPWFQMLFSPLKAHFEQFHRA
jgi:isopentenyl-diphosphate delta-isomerase